MLNFQPISKKKKSKQHAHAAAVMFSLLIVTLTVNMQVPLYNAYAQNGGYGYGMIAVTFSFYVVGLIPILIIFGGLSDRIGRKPTMLIALVAALIANLLIIFSSSIHTLLLMRIFQGVAVGLSLGTSAAYISEVLGHSRNVANITGIIVTIGLGSGSLITSISLLFSAGNTPLSYYGIIVATIICIIMMCFMPNHDVIKSEKMIRLPFIYKDTMKYCISIFIAWSLTGIVLAAVPGELERLGFSGWSGFLVFLAIFTGAVFQPWSRHLGPVISMSVGIVLIAAAYIVLIVGIWYSSLPMILLAAACSGASSFGFIYLGGLAAVMKASGSEKARVVSGYFLFAYLGLGFPCIFIGYLTDAFGLLESLSTLGGAILVILAALYALNKVGIMPFIAKIRKNL